MSEPRPTPHRSTLSAYVIVTCLWSWLLWAPAGTSISGMPVTISTVGAYLLMLVGYSICLVWILGRTRGSVLMEGVFHLSLSAAVYRVFLPGLPGDTRWELERYSLIPLWTLVVLLVVTGQLLRTGVSTAEGHTTSESQG